MVGQTINSFLTEPTDPVYLVESGARSDADIARRIRQSGLANPVERVSRESLSTATGASPAGIVCLWSAPAAESPSDKTEVDGGEFELNGEIETRSLLEEIAATGVDCPVVAVGEGVDVAAAYDAGATDVVPLDVRDHPDLVAEKLAAELGRAQNERLLSDLIDETADGLLLHDPETGAVLACNDRYCEMLGRDPATTVTLAEITTDEGEFTRDRAIELIRRAADGEPTTFEWKPPTDGERDTWVEVTLEAVTLANRRYVIASVRDIQRRKEREQELRASQATFRRLHEITADPEMDVDERIRELLSFGAAELGTDIGFLSRIDPDAGEFEVVEAEGTHPLIRAGAESALGETYCRRVVGGEGEPPVAIRDAEAAGMAGDPPTSASASGVTSAPRSSWTGSCTGRSVSRTRSRDTNPSPRRNRRSSITWRSGCVRSSNSGGTFASSKRPNSGNSGYSVGSTTLSSPSIRSGAFSTSTRPAPRSFARRWTPSTRTTT